MDDIAKHLSISKKTIYQFFKDKDEVVHSLMAVKLQEDEVMFKSIHDNAKNVIEEVLGMMRCMREVFSKINPILFYELQKFYPTTWQLFNDFKYKCVLQLVEASIEKGKKEGLIRGNIHAKILSRLRLEEIEMAFNPTIFPPDKYSILDVQISLTEHFLYGICTLKGHKLMNKYQEIIEEE